MSESLLDLVRQHGEARTGVGYSQGVGQRVDIDTKKADVLFALIEAEVQRLRDERDETALQSRLAMESAHEELDLARKSRDEAHNRLQVAEREIVQLSRCKPGSDGVTCIVADWPHRSAFHGGTVVPDLPAAPLTLPEVPEGAVAAVGANSGDRYTVKRDDRYYDRRPTFETESWWGDIGELLSREPLGVTFETAPPREPRTWPKLEGPPDDLRLVEIEGSGVVWQRERTGNRWVGGHERLTWSQLRARGEVRELLGGAA